MKPQSRSSRYSRMTSMNPRPSPTGKRASARLEKAGSTNPSSAMMGNPVKQDRTLAPLSSSTQLALTHAPSGYTPLGTAGRDGKASSVSLRGENPICTGSCGGYKPLHSRPPNDNRSRRAGGPYSTGTPHSRQLVHPLKLQASFGVGESAPFLTAAHRLYPGAVREIPHGTYQA